MKKISLNNILIMAATVILALTITAFRSRNDTSVAWYSANVKEAQAKNQQCHNDPSIKSSEECANALHALEISFGVNRK